MNSPDSLNALARQMEQFAAAVSVSEQRVRRLERQNQRLWYGIFAILVLAGAGYAMAMMPHARAEGVVERVEADARDIGHDIERAGAAAGDTVVRDLRASRAAFEARIESLRADLNEVDDMENHAAATVAVLLHDIKAMLEAMPGMAHNMAVMTQDVNRMTFHVDQMDRKMGVITGGVDSTMGRMGRMMPGGW